MGSRGKNWQKWKQIEPQPLFFKPIQEDGVEIKFIGHGLFPTPWWKMNKMKVLNIVENITDKIHYWLYIRPAQTEKNLHKRTEKKILLEINGTLLGGMAASGAYTEFKTRYYEKLPNEEEKKLVRDALLRILKSDEYKIREKALTAYVCADILVEGSAIEIEKLLKNAKKGSIEEKEFRYALEALIAQKPISSIIINSIEERGEI